MRSTDSPTEFQHQASGVKAPVVPRARRSLYRAIAETANAGKIVFFLWGEGLTVVLIGALLITTSAGPLPPQPMPTGGAR